MYNFLMIFRNGSEAALIKLDVVVIYRRFYKWRGINSGI